jgi:hypothetical protein
MDLDDEVVAYVAKRYQPAIFEIISKRFEATLKNDGLFDHVSAAMPELRVPVTKEIFLAAIDGMTLKDIVTFDEAAAAAAPREKKPASASGLYLIEKPGISASGDFDRDAGAMTLKAGSHIAAVWSQTKSDSSAYQIHKHLVESELVTKGDGENLTLEVEITVSSPALAASLVLGGNHPTSQWKATGSSEDLVTEASRKAAGFTWSVEGEMFKMTENGQQDA